jgi:Flp pilus assembly protein protease CpaA
MIGSLSLLQTGLALILLFAGVADDLRSRKVHNKIIILAAVIFTLFLLIAKGPGALMIAGLSLMTAFVATLPVYMLRVFGGGDYKLLLVLSLLLSWEQVLITLAASMIWGSLLGIFQVLLKGQGKQFAHNLLAIGQRVKISDEKTHKVPFTVALFFGFLTSLYYGGSL